MNRGFVTRTAKIKDGRSPVLMKRETMDILGVREASLTQLERLAGVPSIQRRIGYTADEAKRLLGALRLVMARSRKDHVGKTGP